MDEGIFHAKITEAQRLLVAPSLRREIGACEHKLQLLANSEPGHSQTKTYTKIRAHYIEKIAALKATLELLIDVSG